MRAVRPRECLAPMPVGGGVLVPVTEVGLA